MRTIFTESQSGVVSIEYDTTGYFGEPARIKRSFLLAKSHGTYVLEDNGNGKYSQVGEKLTSGGWFLTSSDENLLKDIKREYRRMRSAEKKYLN